MSSSLDTDLVCQYFKTMELRTKEEKFDHSKIIVELRAKYRSSFIGGKITGNISEPGYHYEENPEQKPYWKNDGAVWTNMSYYERAQNMEKIAEIIEREAGNISEIESVLHCTSIKKITSDILPFLARYVRYYAGWAGLTTSEPFKPKGCIAVDVRSAYFPLLEAFWGIGPALAVGNTVNVLVSKRFESLLHLAQQCFTSGLPAGTLNIILTPGIDKPPLAKLASEPSIVFAPYQSAKQAGVISAVNDANCMFSLDSYSCMLVLHHADVEAAVSALIDEAILQKNLTCWPLSEVLVEEYLYKDFTYHLKRCVANLDPNSIPRLTSQEQEWLADTKLQAETANLDVVTCENFLIMLGGRAPEMPNNWEPETKPRPLAVLPVRSRNEALSIVSSRPRSLFASVWTEDGTLAHEVAASLNMGIVWINQHGVLPHPAAGFGNWNLGGGAHFGGKEGLLSFTRCSVCEISQTKGSSVLKVKTRFVNKGETQSAPLLNMYWGGETRKSAQTCFILDAKDKPVAQTSTATTKDADLAIGAAAKAWSGWVACGAQNRASMLRAVATALKNQEENFVSLLTAATSVGEMHAREELQAAIKAICHWIHLADKVQGKLIGDGKPGSYLVSRQALGVVTICGGGAALTSLSSVMSLVATALVLGNTVVLGAAESNPIPALVLAQTLLLHAPLPHGVLNVLTWGTENALAAHPDVAAIWAGPSVKLASPCFKRSWRLSETCNPVRCPDQWLIYQATKQKTVGL